MKAERARLARLRRLERIRDVACRTAMAEAGRAEGTLAQLQTLADRTARMAAEYAARSDAGDAASLLQLSRFVAGLDRITTGTNADAARARQVADAKAQEVATAERRRAAVEDRAGDQARKIARKADNQPVLGSRKGFGTGLE